MNYTPRTAAIVDSGYDVCAGMQCERLAILASGLELELNSANAKIAELEKELECIKIAGVYNGDFDPFDPA